MSQQSDALESIVAAQRELAAINEHNAALEDHAAESDAILDTVISHLHAQGFTPTGISLSGLAPGETPRTTINYQRTINGQIETRKWIIE